MQAAAKYIFFFFLITITGNALAQTARFFADTAYFYQHRKSNPDLYNRILEAEWRIGGQVLHYGAAPVVVKTDTIGPDTIFYRQLHTSGWDTMLCSISVPGDYHFRYNSCCGAFDPGDETGKRVSGSVIFHITGVTGKRKLMGLLGEGGILLQPGVSDTLEPLCHSMVMPNIYPLSIREIIPCKDTAGCREGACMLVPGKEEPDYEFGYRTLSTVFRGLYLPLRNEPLHVYYDIRSRKITFR